MLWFGTFDEEDGIESWGLSGRTAAGNAAVVGAPGDHGKAIRISNAGGGTRGDRWGYEGRFGFEEAGIDVRDEAYFRYYVWFPDDYEFETEGKMPALQGVAPGNPPWIANSSLKCPSGRYKGKDCHDDRQFGTRTMWRNGGMITYLNVVAVAGGDRDNNRTSSGDNFNFIFSYQDAKGNDLKFKAGWNYVEQHVRLNTPGKGDGLFEGWINGTRGVRRTDVEYRTGSR